MITPDEFFAGQPKVHSWAPGRVNLLGEHTDYNDGFMLPIATPQRTDVMLSPSDDGRFHLYSATLGESCDFAPSEKAPDGYGRYIEGCIRLVQQRGAEVPPLRIFVHSNLTLGAGLSSSAALEVATLRALNELLDLKLDGVTIARIAQQAEIQYAGVNCGIMDQMAASLADSEHMLFLDARSLDTRLLPLPAGSEVLVVDSGVSRTLAASKYNERRAECEQAAQMLGIPSLRDVTRLEDVEALPAPLRQRARHVVSENLRVQEACGQIEPERFGQLMNASHASLRDDYEVSIAALDTLTDVLRSHAAVYGARLTGAGFGGACVALCRQGHAAAAGHYAVQRVNAAGGSASMLIPRPRPERGI